MKRWIRRLLGNGKPKFACPEGHSECRAEHWRGCYQTAFEEWEVALAENARLQELVTDAWFQFSHTILYDGKNEANVNGGLSTLEEIEDYLHGKGIIDEHGQRRLSDDKQGKP